MTKRDVLAIAFRILGVLALFRFLASIPAAAWAVAEAGSARARSFGVSDPKLEAVMYSVYLVLFLLISLALLFRADRIAARLMPDDSQIQPLAVADSERTVFSLALRIAGVYLLATNLPGLGNVFARVYENIREAAPMFGTMRLQQNLSTLIAIALGFYLIFAPKQPTDWVYGREETTSP